MVIDMIIYVFFKFEVFSFLVLCFLVEVSIFFLGSCCNNYDVLYWNIAKCYYLDHVQYNLFSVIIIALIRGSI